MHVCIKHNNIIIAIAFASTAIIKQFCYKCQLPCVYSCGVGQTIEEDMSGEKFPARADALMADIHFEKREWNDPPGQDIAAGKCSPEADAPFKKREWSNPPGQISEIFYPLHLLEKIITNQF